MLAFSKIAYLRRSRIARVVLAFFLLGLTTWAFAPYFEYRIAPSAFINAELLRVTTPIAGRLTQNIPHKGEFIAWPEKVTLVDSIAPDRRHLLDLERQYATSEDVNGFCDIVRMVEGCFHHSSLDFGWAKNWFERRSVARKPAAEIVASK